MEWVRIDDVPHPVEKSAASATRLLASGHSSRRLPYRTGCCGGRNPIATRVYRPRARPNVVGRVLFGGETLSRPRITFGAILAPRYAIRGFGERRLGLPEHTFSMRAAGHLATAAPDAPILIRRPPPLLDHICFDPPPQRSRAWKTKCRLGGAEAELGRRRSRAFESRYAHHGGTFRTTG